MARETLNRYVDHAVLQPRLTREEALAAIRIGVAYGVRSVCVRPADIELAFGICRGTQTEVGTVLSFPHGCMSPNAKAAEARAYAARGVSEIDMVANYGLIRSGEWELVEDDIRAVSQITAGRDILLKVILEVSELTDEQIARATEAAIAADAQFVKTSTGFSSGGATPEAVAIMVQAAAGRIQVKASGGIREARTAEAYLEMGCTRLGIGSASTPQVLAGASTIMVDGPEGE